ncbi:MAG TPA: hypothetical protein VFV12_03165, partial [Xanthobacteraceae bacterium]|nr:hypothetical protein [Xanthobacteraceae bacterium]
QDDDKEGDDHANEDVHARSPFEMKASSGIGYKPTILGFGRAGIWGGSQATQVNTAGEDASQMIGHGGSRVG